MSFVFKIAFLLVFGPAVCDNEPGDNKTAVEATTLVQNSNKTIVASWQPFTHRMLAEVRALIVAKSSKLTAEFEKRSGTAAASQPPSFAKNSVADNTHTDNKGVAGIAASNYPPFVENTMADSTVAYDKHIPGTAAATPPPSLVENRGAENKSETTENGLGHRMTADTINKQKYDEWANTAKTTMLALPLQYGSWPTKLQPAQMNKKKRVLTVFPKQMREYVRDNKIEKWTLEWQERLKEKKINILSLGKQTSRNMKTVNFGFHISKTDKNVKYPAIAPGGVSNANQAVGSDLDVADNDIFQFPKWTEDDRGGDILEKWRHQSATRLAQWENWAKLDNHEKLDDVFQNFEDVLMSAGEALAGWEDLEMAFFDQPEEPLKVFAAAHVKEVTGAYYTRTNGVDDNEYAQLVQDEEIDHLYFAVGNWVAAMYTKKNILFDNEPNLVR